MWVLPFMCDRLSGHKNNKYILMKKYLLGSILVLAAAYYSFAQSGDPLVAKCITNAGSTARYLKDFRIQLGKRTTGEEFRYKATMSLWKNTKYRFTMCNSDDSDGQLIMNLMDEDDKMVASSVDEQTGKSYGFIDFVCNRSGIYEIHFDFTGGESGSAIGVVSMIR